MRRSTPFVALLLFVTPLGAADAPPRPKAKPVQVFILAGQSNMEGQGLVTMKDEAGKERPGTLEAMKHDPAKAPLLKHLLNAKGEWAEKRDDVWVFDVNESGARHGPLEFGYGWDLGSRDWFGPELQFGHVVGDHFNQVGDHFNQVGDHFNIVGDHFKQQVLIIKTAWGGKDLYKDFRPPGAGGTVGPCYVEMIATVKKVVGDLKTLFPADAGGGFELAGFVWWHGWNDFCSPDQGAPEYETNLTHLIEDVRKDLKAPRLPVVVGEFTGPWGADCKEAAAVTIRKAQKAVAARPEFAGSVVFVETHDFVRAEKESPTDEGYHEFKNGETYFLIGDAFGKAMVALLH